MSTADKIVDWYWEYGVKRGMNANDPDSICRRMSIANWLDPVTKLIRRRGVISRNANGKCCIALWGPSQTGKSTMLSRYVDGNNTDGSDSALSWDPAHPVRFSPTQDWATMCFAYPNTLVFNPFNHGSDASGLATRYVLREDGDPSVNHEFPVEVKLATDMQLMHALSIGYQEECKHNVSSGDEELPFTPASFGELLESGAVDQQPRKEAYEILKDVADSMEFMKGQERFNHLFVNRGAEWRRTLRPRLMDSRLIADVHAAEDFRSKVLWQGSARLTDFFNKVSLLGRQLRVQWQGKKIVASPEVAAILLDIDSFRVFNEPDSMEGQKVRNRVAHLAWTIDAATNEVRLSVGEAGSPEISGSNFGCFQALCAELVVPLKKSALQAPGKEAFLALMEKCDVLDLPGLSNINKGGMGDIDEANGVDLAAVKEIELFKKVFKEGKTQSFVYGYANSFGVDAFLILVRTDRSPSKSEKLNSGIRAWQRAYDPDWVEGRPASMPVFLDMTFFATCVNTVAMSGVGTGLVPYVSRIQEELRFTDKKTAKWFTTTYPQFPTGNITCLDRKSAVVDQIVQDEAFVPRTGLERESLEAVFSPDGGVNHMISAIAAMLDGSKRRSKCARILEDDWAELRTAIQQHLPTEAATGEEALRRSLEEIQVALEAEMVQIESRKSTKSYSELAWVLKQLLKVSPEMFDAIPENAYSEELDGYVNKQIGNWYANRMNNLEAVDWLDAAHQQVLVGALRNVLESGDGLYKMENFIRTRLGQLTDLSACREGTSALATAIENIFWSGEYDRKNDVSVGDGNPKLLDRLVQGQATRSKKRDDSPHYIMVIKPFMDRLTEFAGIVVCGERPPQPGDDELKALFDALAVERN